MQNRIPIIPKPTHVENRDGVFRLTSSTRILAEPGSSGAVEVATYLAGILGSGRPLNVEPHSGNGPVAGAVLITSLGADVSLGGEGYALDVSPDSIVIRAPKAAGLFYGAQTLRQLIPVTGGSEKSGVRKASSPVSCVKIVDRPRYAWRGYMLDSSRHFQSKAFILEFLETLAAFKINVFHWHLVDAEAWRMEVKKYPELVMPRVTGYAPAQGAGGSNHLPPTQAEGYYTQQDIKEIVDRARSLHITVMPELEVPGHAVRAVATVPGVICQGPDGQDLPPGSAGEFCLGSEKTMEFVRDVLSEMAGLFPDSPCIHTGGDEAADGNWKNCPRCRAKMKELGTDNPRLLQKWFMNEVAALVRAQGRTSVAWADHLELGVPEGQIVHGWHGEESEYAVRHGFRTINSDHVFTYLDYPQDPAEPKFDWMRSLSLKECYAFDPDSAGETPEQKQLILGTEAHLWTEIVEQNRVQEKTFPRFLAVAEVAWTPQEGRDYSEFLPRLKAFLPRLEAMGIPCYPRFE